MKQETCDRNENIHVFDIGYKKCHCQALSRDGEPGGYKKRSVRRVFKQKCSQCGAEGYHESYCSNKFAIGTVSDGDVSALCTAERFPDSPLLDTRVELTVQPFAVTWKDREKLVKAISKIIEKYRI